MNYNSIKRSTQGLIALTLLCVAFVIVRIVLESNLKFSFLLWNLFLAWVPFFLSNLLLKFHSANKGKIAFIIIFFVWILFLPNSLYIITDLLHLKYYEQKILWFDSLLIFVFGMTGLLIGLFSIENIFVFIRKYLKKGASWFAIFILYLLAGFGIFLGRYCRLNSWDLFHKPLWFFERVFHQFINPLTYEVTILYALVLFVIFFIFHNYYLPAEKNNGKM